MGVDLCLDPDRVLKCFVLVHDAQRMEVGITRFDDKGFLTDPHTSAALLLVDDGMVVGVLVSRVAPLGRKDSKVMIVSVAISTLTESTPSIWVE
jgi:hypothetical protein